VSATTTRRPTIPVTAMSRRARGMLALSLAVALWSTVDLGPVSGFFTVVLLLACTAVNLGILNGVATVHDARTRLARARPLDPRAERALLVARCAALVAGALLGAYLLTAGGPWLSSASALGCLAGGAVAELGSACAELAVRAVGAPRRTR
jgi:hypothetical protein